MTVSGSHPATNGNKVQAQLGRVPEKVRGTGEHRREPREDRGVSTSNKKKPGDFVQI